MKNRHDVIKMAKIKSSLKVARVLLRKYLKNGIKEDHPSIKNLKSIIEQLEKGELP